jgi:ubiquinone biosynthesis protein UbiJ
MSIDPTLTTAVFAALERAVNAAIALDPRTVARLRGLEGKVMAVRLRGLDITFYLAPKAGGLRVMSHYDGPPDTVLTGAPLDLAQLAGSAPTQSMFKGRISLDGDAEVGQKFQRIIGGLDIDWEEHLSRLTGDVIAHQVGNLARGFFGWTRDAASNLGRDGAEYLQGELRLTPTRQEAEIYFSAVDELRSDCDRLEARVQRLRKTLAATGSQSADD